MTEQEGVVKYQLDFQFQNCLTAEDVADLESWRHICYRLNLIGQTPERYQGYGFGNISQRMGRYATDAFIISGTQTGGQPHLTHQGYSLITSCKPFKNCVQAMGVIEPSSEAMTHGQIYQLHPNTNVVVHAHSPEIWNNAPRLGLAMTDKDVAYGTVDMAREVERLFNETQLAQQKIFVMPGHLDGVVSFGETPAEAVGIMTSALAAALRC